MSAGIDEPLDPASIPADAVRPSGAGAGIATAEVCPFLRSRDGAWSSTHSARDLRCWAVQPAAQPAIAKQRQMCLVGAHASCATFVAASARDGWPAASAEEPGSQPDTAGLWPETRPVPVALETVRVRSGVAVAAPRSGGQALLVALMVIAFIVVVIARTTSLAGTGAAPAGSGEASLPAVAASSALPSSPGPTASASMAPSPVPSSSAVATASPKASSPPSSSPASSPRAYRVRAGDTLSGIAATYGTTVKALAAANGITDVRTIHVGQVLIIP